MVLLANGPRRIRAKREESGFAGSFTEMRCLSSPLSIRCGDLTNDIIACD